MFRKIALIAVLLVFSASMFAQGPGGGQGTGGGPVGGGGGVLILTVAKMNALTNRQKGQVVAVTDGTSTTDCATGQSTYTALCQYTGSTWTAVSGSGGSMTWPGAAGITACTGTPCAAWGTSISWSSGTSTATMNITGNAGGNAATATNLANYPTLCTGGQFSQGLSSGSNNCATPSGGGTVISVGLSLPSFFSVSNSPVTTSGTLTGAYATGLTGNENQVLSVSASGAAQLAALTAAMIPASLSSTTSVNGTTIPSSSTLMTTSTSLALAQTPLTTAGDTLYVNSSPALARLAIGTTGTAECVSSGLPAWCSSLSGVTSVNGTTIPSSSTFSATATASNTVTQYDVLVGGASSAVGSVGPGTSGQPLLSGGPSANPAYGTLGNAGLTNSSTAVNSQTCALGSSCTIPFQTNSSGNTSQAGINLLTSTTNSVGLTVTPTNSATNQEKFEVTGSSYSGNAATATALASVPSQCGTGNFSTGIAASGNANCSTAVTSVALGLPTGFVLSGSPVIGTGTLTMGMPSSWTTGDLLVGNGSNSVARLALGSTGQCLTSNGTTEAWGSCAASGSITSTGSPSSGQGTYFSGSTTITGNSNWTYASATGHSLAQGANNVDAFFMSRFTDSSPTGNFLHFQNAAKNADVFKVDISGNVTGNSFNGVTVTSSTGTLTVPNSATLQQTGAYTLNLTVTNNTTPTFPTGTGTLAYLAGTNSWTGTNTFTSPEVVTSILDTNANTLLGITATGSAVNYLTLTNAATTGTPALGATGSDTNVSLNLTTKGNGTVQANGSPIAIAPGPTTAQHQLLGFKDTGGINLEAETPILGALTGGDLCLYTSSGTVLSCNGPVSANVVVASSPGAGVGHFAGSTQTLTSSAVVGADFGSSVGAYTVLGNTSGSAGTPAFTGNPAVSSVVLEGSTSGSATLGVSATGGTVDLGSTNATVTSGGALTADGITNSAISTAGVLHANSSGVEGSVTDTRNKVFNLQAPASGDDNIYAVFDPPVAIHLRRFACGVTGSSTPSVVSNLYESGPVSLLADQTCTSGSVETVTTTTWANGSSQCGATTSCAVAAHTPITLHVGTISGTVTNLAISVEYTVDGLN